MIGGPGVAYNIGNDRSRFPKSQRPNGGDMMLGAAESGTPVDFFTFHDVNPCLDAAVCNVTDVSLRLFSDLLTRNMVLHYSVLKLFSGQSDDEAKPIVNPKKSVCFESEIQSLQGSLKVAASLSQV